MSEKKLVCHGAVCECKFGEMPNKLVVMTQKKTYINDSQGSQKLIATDKDTGVPFEKKMATFGRCKLQPIPGGFRPCNPDITAWDNFYEKTQIKDNDGYPLTEDSKATCSIAGAPCVEITFHGQTAEPSSQNLKNADEEIISQVLPIVNVQEIKNPPPYESVEATINE